MGFTLVFAFLTGLFRVLPGFTGFFRVLLNLPSFILCYLV